MFFVDDTTPVVDTREYLENFLQNMVTQDETKIENVSHKEEGDAMIISEALWMVWKVFRLFRMVTNEAVNFGGLGFDIEATDIAEAVDLRWHNDVYICGFKIDKDRESCQWRRLLRQAL